VSRLYITTPIYYINAEPHLGHAYTTMVADAVARAHRLMGDEVFFLTGTDEYGQKVERAADRAGLAVRQFADQVSQRFRDLLPTLNISHDDFIRTTEPRHHHAAQTLWRQVRDRGYIYKGEYRGWYCTVDEVFVPDTQLREGRCPICGNAVERIAEQSYFFRLSAFQTPLVDHYKAHPDFVTPDIRRNEMLAFLEAGLEDLSISRTSFTWGIPVPDDPAHVMYVWFDALTNYLTAAGYGDPGAAARFSRYWPADVHLIGKEIVRQHAVYWPALLMAAGLPVPRRIVSHGWWLMEGAKMSKSIGNVVRPQGYVDRFGVDGLRYFVFREMSLGQDASFTDEAILTRYNADLANDLGNLVSRAVTMIERYCGGAVPSGDPRLLARPEEVALVSAIDGLVERVQAAVRQFQLSLALRDVWEVIAATNRYIVAREPWQLARHPEKRAELDTALVVAADAVRVVAELLRPFMPRTGERTLRMLGIEPSHDSWRTPRCGTLVPGRRVGRIEALFPRIEKSVEELQTMTSEEQGAAPGPGEPSPPREPADGAGLSPAGAGRLSIDDFMKVELRAARVLAAERVPKSTRLLKLLVDTGVEQRTIVAGIAEAYEPEALVGRTVVVVCNLKPAKLMGVESNGMVLAASPEGGAPMLLGIDGAPAPGTRVR
jgi:methionyl-tRNA synthetase